MGQIIFLPIIWTHFLACEDVAGRSQQSGGNVFFAKYGGPSSGSLLSGGGIIILRVIRRHFPVWAPTVSLFRWLLFVHHVDLATESTNPVDEGKAQEGNYPEPVKPPQRMPTLRGV